MRSDPANRACQACAFGARARVPRSALRLLLLWLCLVRKCTHRPAPSGLDLGPASQPPACPRSYGDATVSPRLRAAGPESADHGAGRSAHELPRESRSRLSCQTLRFADGVVGLIGNRVQKQTNPHPARCPEARAPLSLSPGLRPRPSLCGPLGSSVSATATATAHHARPESGGPTRPTLPKPRRFALLFMSAALFTAGFTRLDPAGRTPGPVTFQRHRSLWDGGPGLPCHSPPTAPPPLLPTAPPTHTCRPTPEWGDHHPRWISLLLNPTPCWVPPSC